MGIWFWSVNLVLMLLDLSEGKRMAGKDKRTSETERTRVVKSPAGLSRPPFSVATYTILLKCFR